MREPYLLAASLLTGLAIPASTFPEMSSIASRNIGFSWDLPHLQEKPREKISLQVVRNSVLPTTPEPSFNHSATSTSHVLVSGDQLYHERWLSLKTGQIYTRIDEENLHVLQEPAKKHQLTYEDWKNLLAMEAKAVTQGQGTNRLSILVGDSLSMWFPKEKLPSGKLWLNQGISGDTSEGVMKRLGAFAGTKAEVIYLMVGINDLRGGVKDMSILHNFRHIIHRLRQTHPHSRIVVQSILPVRVTSISNSHIRQLNGKITWIAQQEGAQYLNIHHWFTDFAGNLRPELTTDGIHLSSEGYDVWRASIQQIEFKLLSKV